MTNGEKKDERVRAEEKYKALVETAADAIITLDLLGRFTFVNPGASRISGYSEEELVGKHFRELLPAKYIPACLNVFQKALRGQPTPPIEVEMITKQGERVPLELLGRPVKRGRRVVEIIGIARDITERKRAEEALRAEKALMDALMDNIPDSIYFKDRQCRLTRINRKMMRDLGLKEMSQALGKTDVDLFGEEFGRETLAQDQHIMTTGKPIIGLIESRRLEDGQINWTSTTKVPLRDASGQIVGLVGATREINEVKQAEEEIQRNYDIQTTLNALLHTSLLDISLEDQLERVLDHILSIPWLALESRGGIFLVEDEREVLVMKAQRELTTPLQTTCAQVPFGRCLCGRAALTQKIQFADRLDDRHETRHEGITGHGHYSVPILSAGRTLGVINLYLKEGHRRDQREEEFLTVVANTLAGIMERKRAEEELRRRITELATFNEIGRAIASTMKLDELWELVYHQTCRVMEVSALYIALYDREKGELRNVINMLYGQPRPRGEKRRPFRKGRTEYVIRTKKPLLIRGEVQETYDRLGIVSADKRAKGFVGVPITASGEVIGVLAVQNYERDDAYDEHTIDLLSTIAHQAAIAIENARLYEETEKRLAETTALHKVAEIINASLDLKEVFQRVVDELSQTFGYRLVDIYLLEEDGLRLQANVGYDDKTTIQLIPLERGVVGRVARTGQPAFVPDVTQDPDYIGSYPEIKSEICVPVKSGETLLGTLNVESDAERPLTDDDLQLLSTLSSHIGVAIENARLYEEERRHSAQRRTIAEVGRKAASILDMDALLTQVVDLIAQSFRYYRVHVFQVDQDSGYAVYKAGTGKAGASIAEEGLRLKIGKEGMIGWVAQHGEPLLANDVNLDPHYVPHPALPDTRSELAVPIHAGKKVIGVLDVQSTELDAFDESDLDTLQTLANQLAVAMENARLYQETKRLAITDSLTSLYNLRYFYEALEKEIQRSERYHRSVSLIILDIDDFKAYNDLYGHLAGDHLLVELAQLMSRVIRQTDTLARYGGEEFAIILPETETEGAGFLAERLQEEVSEYRFSMQDGQTIGRITISLGVATYPHHADSAKALVDAADKALLRAKRAGKNRVSVCEEELTELKPR